MKKTVKMRMAKIALMTSGVSFIMTGVVYFEESKLFTGMLQSLIGIGNLLILFFMSENRKDQLNCLVLILNMIAALFISIDYFLSGKTHIQYAWLLVVFMNLIALFIQLGRGKTSDIHR